MELRNLAFFLGLVVLAVCQCSEARHSMRRREADDDVYYADEGKQDDVQNDEDDADRSPEVKNEPPEVQAKITTTPNVYEVKKGEVVRLECNVDPDNGKVTQWYKDSEMYFMNTIKTFYGNLERYSIAPDSRDLIIKDVKQSDAGIFKCEVAQESPVSVNHTLVVLQSPQIVQFTASNEGSVVEGSDLLLTCQVTGMPPPQIIWSRTVEKGNQRLGEQDGEFSQNSVFIKGVKREHSGKYYCYAINSVGSDQHELQVSIAGSPRVHVHKTVVNSDIMVEAVLQCSSHYEANPHIRWYKDGKLIEDSSSEYVVSTHGTHSNLTVIPDSDDDFGTFTCEAENNIGKHNRSIDLVQRPVVESLGSEDGKLAWTVHSHQPLQELQAQLKSIGEDGEWKQFNIPLPPTASHRYELTFDLNDKELAAGQYQAVVKARNDHNWSDNVEPVVVNIDARPSMSIQHASVFRGSNAHSIRPSSVILSTVLMYLLVRTL